MTFETLLYDVSDRVLTLTLNRPERMNAFNSRMCDELISAFDRADADDDIKVVIVTGSGRAFCAGSDLEKGGDTWNKHADYIAAQSSSDRYVGDGGGRITRRIYDFNKPVIAAINWSRTLGFEADFDKLLSKELKIPARELKKLKAEADEMLRKNGGSNE